VGGAIAGIELPRGLREGDRLPEAILTPSTKADVGRHDETITFDDMAAIIGTSLATRVREAALMLYDVAATRCERAGILLADTKFEFGVWPGPEDLVLVDEVLTPDSSRFWDAAAWSPGGPKPGILEPQGRAVEGSLGHLGIAGVSDVRVGRRVELTVDAPSAGEALAIVDRLASELLSNPLIEAYAVEVLGAASAMMSTNSRG